MILAELEVDRIVDEIVIEDEDGTAEVLDRLDEYAEQREKAEAAQ